MLTEKTIDDKIEVVSEHKIVQVRRALIIEKDGVEVSRSFSRRTIAPGHDYSKETEDVQSICAAVHTPEVIAAYKAATAAQGV